MHKIMEEDSWLIGWLVHWLPHFLVKIVHRNAKPFMQRGAFDLHHMIETVRVMNYYQ